MSYLPFLRASSRNELLRQAISSVHLQANRTPKFHTGMPASSVFNTRTTKAITEQERPVDIAQKQKDSLRASREALDAWDAAWRLKNKTTSSPGEQASALLREMRKHSAQVGMKSQKRHNKSVSESIANSAERQKEMTRIHKENRQNEIENTWPKRYY